MENAVLHYEQDDIYLRALDSIYDGVTIYDGNGKNLYVNQPHLNQVGIERKEYQELLLQDLPNAKPPICSQLITSRAFESGKTTSGIVEYYRTEKTCLVSSVPMSLKSGEIVVASIVRDLTELIDLQNRLELAERYKDRLRELEAIYESPAVTCMKSKAMTDIYEKAVRILNVNAPVLILGETGVGKDFLARFIYDNSCQAGPFVKVNCGAIPGNLLESELFGYERGAFTGANREGKMGLIELANHGTLYLDEIGEMPPDLQVKLLGVLQDKKITRVGGTKSVDIQFRIISATNANLERRIAEGRFRQDLYYRLNVINFFIPPLKERQEDIFPLALQFLEELNQRYEKKTFLEPKAVAVLTCYGWPGNIRELKNTLERLVVLADQPCITEQIISESLLYKDAFLKPNAPEINWAAPDSRRNLKDAMDHFERSMIEEALKRHMTLLETAKHLGIDPSTLLRKKRKYSL